MGTMKKRTVIAFTAGVWVAALVSAAALAYVLNRPLPLAEAAPDVPAPDHAAMSNASAQTAAEPRVLYVSTFTVAARPPHRAPVAHRRAPAGEAPALRCAGWRDLDIGSGRVQVCD
jgi:hypothetical protein